MKLLEVGVDQLWDVKPLKAGGNHLGNLTFPERQTPFCREWESVTHSRHKAGELCSMRICWRLEVLVLFGNKSRTLKGFIYFLMQ